MRKTGATGRVPASVPSLLQRPEKSFPLFAKKRSDPSTSPMSREFEETVSRLRTLTTSVPEDVPFVFQSENPAGPGAVKYRAPPKPTRSEGLETKSETIEPGVPAPSS